MLVGSWLCTTCNRLYGLNVDECPLCDSKDPVHRRTALELKREAILEDIDMAEDELAEARRRLAAIDVELAKES